MPAEHAVAIGGLVFLVIGGFLLVRTVESGKVLSKALALRFPDTFEALGRPRPTYFQSPRHQRFSRFVMQREYRTLPDPTLVASFEAHRQKEVLFLTFLLGGFGVLGLAVLLLKLVSR